MNTVGIQMARRGTGVLGLFLALLLVPFAPASAGERPPAGRLLSATPYTPHLLPGVPLPGVRAWKIRYASQGVHGPETVTGSVLAPARPTALVGFAVGTQGLADRCAPSRRIAEGTEYETPQIARLLQRGWAVAVTDYPGLGTPSEHTYLMGQVLAQSVLDSMRAARQLRSAAVASLPTAVTGYSEGGQAAGWTAQIARSYAPDLALRGVAAGGVVADLPANMRALDGGVQPSLALATLAAFDSAHPSLHLAAALTDEGRRIVRELRQGCVEDGSASFAPLRRTREVSTRDLFSIPAFARLLRAENLGGARPQVPVLLQHVRTDELIPYATVTRLRDQWRARGGDVDFRDVPAPDHLTGGPVSLSAALTWLAARLSPEERS